MPFTPLHMGPGLALKSLLGARFSLMLFGFSQVAMDIEPLVRILRDDDVLHGWTHTVGGATAIGVFSIVGGRPACQWILDRWPREPGHWLLERLRGPQRISAGSACAGALLGTWSHVLLDGIMHSDIRPLAPFAPGNALLGVLPIDALHLACIGCGAAGAALLLAVSIRRGRSAA